MSFINTIATTEATGTIKEIYDAAQASSGYVPHYAELFSLELRAALALGRPFR